MPKVTQRIREKSGLVPVRSVVTNIIVCCYFFHRWWERGAPSPWWLPGLGMNWEGKQGMSPPTPALLRAGRTPLTRVLGRHAHQALHGLQQLVLLVLQEAGVAAGGAQAALQAGEGAVLAAQ